MSIMETATFPPSFRTRPKTRRSDFCTASSRTRIAKPPKLQVEKQREACATATATQYASANARGWKPKNPLFKERYAQEARRLKKAKQDVQAQATAERGKAILEHRAPEEARKLFDLLLISPKRLRELGLAY